MKITCVGCGTAFSDDPLYNQSYLLEEDGELFLIDCGANIPLALKRMGIPLSKIKHIYVSHGHGDHYGGLERFAFQTYDWLNRPKHYSEYKVPPTALVGNAGFLKDLWEHGLSLALRSMEGFPSTLDTFFKTVPIEPNGFYMWKGWKMEPVQQTHVVDGNSYMPSYGLMMSKEGHKTVYFTTDSQHFSPKQIKVFYEKADLIFQDSELAGCNFLFQEGEKFYEKDGKCFLWPADAMEATLLLASGIEPRPWRVFKFGSGVHANYAELAGFDSANETKLDMKVRSRMFLSHYQDFKLDNKDAFGNTLDWDKQATKDGFAGFAFPGMVWDTKL